MATSNRAAIYNKLYKILKKHYKPVSTVSNRSVLEHMLYASCLENSFFDKADFVYENVQNTFYDWNEVRVTTVAELSEIMPGLYDPSVAATRLKKVLQNVFESCYSFEIESLRKQNIGKAIKLLEKYGGTPFAIAYATQHALAGHSIPKDKGTLQSLYIIGAITETESAAGQAPGLERTIPKNKGIEFSSLLHQLAADLTKSPHAPAVRAIFLEVTADAKDRLPKRRKKTKPAAKSKTTKKQTTKQPTAKSKTSTTKKKKTAVTKKKKTAAAKKKKTAATKKKKAAATKKKKTAATKKKKTAVTKKKKTAAAKKTVGTAKKKKVSSVSQRLSKRKPK